MVKKKTTRRKAPVRAAGTRRIYRRRAKSGYDKIAPAMATVGLVLANADHIKNDFNKIQQQGPVRFTKNFVGDGAYYRKYIQGNQLVNDAIYTAGGYIGGELIRKYAPAMIKKPIAKIAKKIPKVI